MCGSLAHSLIAPCGRCGEGHCRCGFRGARHAEASERASQPEGRDRGYSEESAKKLDAKSEEMEKRLRPLEIALENNIDTLAFRWKNLLCLCCIWRDAQVCNAIIGQLLEKEWV